MRDDMQTITSEDIAEALNRFEKVATELKPS